MHWIYDHRHAMAHAEDEEHQAFRQWRYILGDEPDEHRKDQGYGAGSPAQGKEDA